MDRSVLVAISATELESRVFATQFHGRSAVYTGLVGIKSVNAQKFSSWWGVKIWREAVGFGAFSSYDQGSQLQGQSQNNPRVASKRAIN
ncbi:hypothetical protein AVEN_54100-1 [Araneus ventricosus]|uniref:Uncharacterized protein n=1 Tax=Araneus ventricosus TaxID=182803 RepID=A0A4Y2BTF8_ARAVE|nr:hypothetical protein AVEN_54100-1 [Araneus ventricosus]